MSETLYQRMNPVAVLVGSSVRRLFTFSTAGKTNGSPSRTSSTAFRSVSMMQSSVPWRRSRNGDTTTICKQASVCLSFSHGCLRYRKISWKFRNPEQHAKHQPKIGVHHEVLVSNENRKSSVGRPAERRTRKSQTQLGNHTVPFRFFAACHAEWVIL